MKKEFIVKSIDTTPDEEPYVLVSLIEYSDFKEQTPQPTSTVMEFTNMYDLSKILPKMVGASMQNATTQLKINMSEYKQLGLAVGDKVFLELTQAENPDV